MLPLYHDTYRISRLPVPVMFLHHVVGVSMLKPSSLLVVVKADLLHGVHFFHCVLSCRHSSVRTPSNLRWIFLSNILLAVSNRAVTVYNVSVPVHYVQPVLSCILHLYCSKYSSHTGLCAKKTIRPCSVTVGEKRR